MSLSSLLVLQRTTKIKVSLMDTKKYDLIRMQIITELHIGPRWINKSVAEAQKVLDYSLLRSAELSLENDFPFFVILSNDSETRELSLIHI